MLSVNTNTASIKAVGVTTRQGRDLGAVLQRLSSGLRVNSAKDDAAGLAISERMTAGIRGNKQAIRNTNDGISMVQTTEGALEEVTRMLQRGRELAVQAANATLGSSDKEALQAEVSQLLAEIERIGDTTTFNSTRLFGNARAALIYPDAVTLAEEKQQILDNLQKGWLENAETLVRDYLGLSATDVDLTIVLDDDIAGASAFVTGSGSTTLVNLELHIDVNEFIGVGLSYPNNAIDQLIAHEMTHAVMAVTTNFVSFNATAKWFVEGTAELLPGGDPGLKGVLDGGATEAQVAANIDNIKGAFGGSALDYATAYAAVRYLNSQIGGAGVKDMLAYLSGDTNRTLDDYFSANPSVGYGDADAFVTDFKTNGAAYIAGLTLGNADDIGGIGGGEASGGPRDTSYSGTVPDTINPTENPLQGFNEVWPTLGIGTNAIAQLRTSSRLDFQVGDGFGDVISMELKSLNTGSLDIEAVNIATDSAGAIRSFDAAISAISQERARLGALQNRFEAAIAASQVYVENITASRSRILDADYALETAELTRTQITARAGVAMVAQANVLPRLALSLLN